MTVVRVKGMLSGGLSTFFDTSDEFFGGEVQEDNVLYQLKHRKYQKGGDPPKIAFYGDYIWDPLFGQYWSEGHHKSWPSLDVRNLDKLDDNAAKEIYKELDNGSDFDLLLGHIIGVDSAGHTYSSVHSEIERKLRDTEQIIKTIVEKMDDKTTLVVFGDHGMTQDGNHGGSSQLEMRTVVFSYQKTGFPMYEKYNKMKRAFEDMDKTIK